MNINVQCHHPVLHEPPGELMAQDPEPLSPAEQQEADATPVNVNTGSPSRTTTTRQLAIRPTPTSYTRLPKWKIEMTKNFTCSACQALRPGGSSSVPPAATHQSYKAWQAVGVDVSEWIIPNSSLKVKFTLMLDLATRLRVIHIIKTYNALEMKGESSADVIEGIATRWLADKPKPQVIIPDNSATMVSKEVSSFLTDAGTLLTAPAEKESWAHGQVEAAIKDIKMRASAIQLGSPSQDPVISLHLAMATMNSTEYVKGYSSYQWCYGKDYHISDEDVRTFANIADDTPAEEANVAGRRRSGRTH